MCNLVLKQTLKAIKGLGMDFIRKGCVLELECITFTFNADGSVTYCGIEEGQEDDTGIAFLTVEEVMAMVRYFVYGQRVVIDLGDGVTTEVMLDMSPEEIEDVLIDHYGMDFEEAPMLYVVKENVLEDLPF